MIVHSSLVVKAKNYSGLYLYRNQFRVMPYGSPKADLFNLEENRSKHAGRYFWSHRRSFGRAAFTRQNNPNLKDKAGREGLVDNRAFREFRLLVEDLLQSVALRYFGTLSEIRSTELDDIQTTNKKSKEAAEKARKGRMGNFRKFLKSNASLAAQSVSAIKDLQTRLTYAASTKEVSTISIISNELEELKERRESLRPPPIPAKLGDQEETYKRFRNDYREFISLLESAQMKLSEISEDLSIEQPEEIANRYFQSNQGRINAQMNRYKKSIESKLSEVSSYWLTSIATDLKSYYQHAAPILKDLQKGVRLTQVLNSLEGKAIELEELFAAQYEPFLRTLDRVIEDERLDDTLKVTDDDRIELERRVNDLNALAQMGIAVEIVGHELEVMDQEVRRNLNRLPDDIKKTEAFRSAFDAHKALADRLRFLAPMRLAEYRSRETITGEELANFIAKFFAKRIQDERVDFEASAKFRSIRIVDLRSRIIPVFINLFNNALYWIRFGETRQIRFDCIADLVVIADSGQGVDEYDVPRLFEIFYTRRANGRGLGLHLSRLNLAVANHTIRYARPEDPHILIGANFIVEFKGLTYA